MRERHRAEPTRRPVVLSEEDPPNPTQAELTFIGTATVLLKVCGFSILTDPNFLHAGERAYLGLGLSTPRQREPAMQIGDLPPLDFVVLSHFHGAHFDRRAVHELDRVLPIVAEPHAARKVEARGFRRAMPLETWETQAFRRGQSTVTVQAVPGKHSPRVLGSVVPPVMGSVLEFSRPGGTVLKLYLTGDTVFFDRLAEIPEHHPRIDICVIHLGGTRLAGVLLTMDDRQAFEALRLIRPRVAVPVHFDDYRVFKSPVEDFLARADEARLDTRVRQVGRGETWRFDLPLSVAA